MQDSIRDRVGFVMKHLTTQHSKGGGRLAVKITDGALTWWERKFVEKSCETFRICQFHCLSKNGFVGFLKLAHQDLVREGSTELDVQTGLCVAVLECPSRDENLIQEVSDDGIENYFVANSGFSAIKEELSTVKEKALKHARLCLTQGFLDVYPSKFLNAVIDYVSYSEKAELDEIQCTIIWKDYKFTSKGKRESLVKSVNVVPSFKAADFDMAIETASSHALLQLLGLALTHNHLSDKKELFASLKPQIRLKACSSLPEQGKDLSNTYLSALDASLCSHFSRF